MANTRSKIHLYPLGSTVWSRQGAGVTPVPPGWEARADLQRGDGSGGRLLQHRQTRLFALWTGAGSMETLPQLRVRSLLDALDAKAGQPAREAG